MYRKGLKRGTDKGVFRRTAVRTKAININAGVTPRGGIRL